AAGRGAEPALPAAGALADGLLFLTHADTDLLCLEKALELLPPDVPPVRAFNVSHLGTDEDVDLFLDRELERAAVVVVRLLGGRASFARGVERIAAHARREGTWTLLLPGTDTLDVELAALSSVAVPVAHEAAAYLQMGGPANYAHLVYFLCDHLLATGFGFDAPTPQPRHGVYHPDLPGTTLDDLLSRHQPDRPTLGILFYRAHLLSGNTAAIDALVRVAEAAGANVLPVFAHSLKDEGDDAAADRAGGGSVGLPAALRYMAGPDGARVDVLISTMSFAMGGINPDGPTMAGWSVEALERLDVPVLQAVLAGGPRVAWETSLRGLGPLDTAMHVALPEFDGRIAAVPISFKEQQAGPASRDDGHGVSLGAPVARAVPVADRVERTVGLALRLAALRRKPNGEKRVAVVLTNNPGRAARVGNAVGLDAPASLLLLLQAMRAAGYTVGPLPEGGDVLLHALIDRCSYDTELLTEHQLAHAAARVPQVLYDAWFESLPERNRREMTGRWGEPPGIAYVYDGHVALAGLQFGNVFVALQPPRGYGLDPSAIYHQPDLPPTHNYHALYRWLRADPACGGFGADAIIHLGKHGTLEWLPGKAVGPSATCYPDLLLADVPLVYPFIINNPGEGAQAKRRTHAVVVDHMVPPMTAADTYGPLAELARLVDEYYQVEQLDPAKLPLLQNQIWALIKEARLESDLAVMMRRTHAGHTHEWDDELLEDGTPAGLGDMRGRDVAHLLEDIDAYLCELGTLQIRNGLHIMGTLPEGEALIDLLASLVRLPNGEVPGLRDAVA
ncbi:MAG TPA: cobaltochelatase subunit CobN, partial [Chloroflexota bacterium]|nr:cobaltochelatase subunit CobN [Chloroflexota bacterium]